MSLVKPVRIVDLDLLARVKREGCVICGTRPADPAHIWSRGAGGPDVDFNVLPLCRKHHTEQHAKGWTKMIEKNPLTLGWKLERLGWILPIKAANGRLSHPKLFKSTPAEILEPASLSSTTESK